MIENSMTKVWRRLEAQFAKKYPSLLQALRPPASMAQIDAYEELTGYALPQDVRDLFMIHDGETMVLPKIEAPRLLSYFEWCSLERAAELWRNNAEVEDHEFPPYAFTEEDAPASWQGAYIRPWEGIPPTWLPIGQSGDSWRYFTCVDMLPGPKGCVGQMVEFGEVSATLVAPSLRAYLEGLADGLESDRLSYVLAPGRWRYVDGRKFTVES